MGSSSSIAMLGDMFKDQDWFFDVGLDQHDRLVVYVKYMCHDTLHNIPNEINGQHVLVHFANYYTATRDQFTNPNRGTAKAVEASVEEEFDLPAFSKHSISDLIQELDRLEKICGSNILQDIFFEIHDGKNAVTNLSAKYPEVREALDVLYDNFGFDVVYEELDG